MLTVLLATRNRARILYDVLQSYCALQSPPSGWKLVVVDNGSTDLTTSVVASFADRLPLHLVSEANPGKNNALNTGLSIIEGDLTVFTDDDTFPRFDWLVQLRQAADCNPNYMMFGGAVLPRWEVQPPSWVEWVNKGPVYTLTDMSIPPGPIQPESVFGPNMAIRASVFQSGVRFDSSIGPRGANYAMGSETELLLRLGREGMKAWYTPDAVVEHYIREEQLTKSWILRRGIRYGRGYFRWYSTQRDQSKRSSAGMCFYLLRKLLAQAVRMVIAFAFFQKEDQFRSQWYLNYCRGQLIEAWSLLIAGEKLRKTS